MFEREKIQNDFVVNHCKYWVKKKNIYIYIRHK